MGKLLREKKNPKQNKPFPFNITLFVFIFNELLYPEVSYFFVSYLGVLKYFKVIVIGLNSTLLTRNIYIFLNLHGNSRHDDAREAP